jgi:hypothetical protein
MRFRRSKSSGGALFNFFTYFQSCVGSDALHGRWLAGVFYAVALYRRGELADAVVAHATTNALLTVYVLAIGSWALWA